MKQSQLITQIITPNRNISFSIGTILAVQNIYEHLNFNEVFDKYKKKGRDINSLIQGLLSYKLTENQSISKASDWINKKDILELLKLLNFEERTLFRVLEIIGINREEIISDVQDRLFEKHKFEHTNINTDWTSFVLYGKKCPLGKYGHSKDHRPDKKQITMGISELASPINIPLGITIKAGNASDMKHFKDTYNISKRKLREGSLITFDKGASSRFNLDLVMTDHMKFLSSKKLNKSDDKRIKEFDRNKAELVDEKRKVYGIKFEKPKKIDYFFFSEALKEEQLIFKKTKAKRKLEEAKILQKCIERGKPLPAKYKIKNELIEIKYAYQTKLSKLSEEEASHLIESAVINGREGFFCLISNKNLTLKEALETYRKKDSLEKIFNSLKNEIEIKPLRVWTENSIYGALIIGFLAQLFISLIRYENKNLKQISTKFIKRSLMNLTVTIEFDKSGKKRQVYANFDDINQQILAKNMGIP